MVGKGENQHISKVETKINSPSNKVGQGVEKKIPHTWESLRKKSTELGQMREKSKKETQEKNEAIKKLDFEEKSQNMGAGAIGASRGTKIAEKVEKDATLTKAEGEYREELKSLYTKEMEIAGGDPTKKHEVEKKVLEEYVGAFELDKARTPEEMKKIAETLPEAYKKMIMDTEADFGHKLNGVRERIYADIYRTERDIIAKGGDPEKIKKELAENFTQVTGIPMSPEEFTKYLGEQRDSEAPEEKASIDDKAFTTTRPVSTQGFMAGGESYGGGGTSGGGGGGGWSGEYASSSGGGGGNSGGGGGSSPETLSSTPSEMTTGTYKWQGRSFKMQGPLKDVTPDMTSPALLAKLAKQGVNPGGSTGTCYKSVKNHICAAGYIPTSYALGGGSAKNAGPDLLSAGFQSVGTRGGQTGDVYVYSGGEHGHIEINTGDGFASDFFSSRPSGRTLIGIYRPPELKTKGNPAPPQVPQKMMG